MAKVRISPVTNSSSSSFIAFFDNKDRRNVMDSEEKLKKYFYDNYNYTHGDDDRDWLRDIYNDGLNQIESGGFVYLNDLSYTEPLEDFETIMDHLGARELVWFD